MTDIGDRLGSILRRTGEERDYTKSLAVFQIEHGLNGLDLTPEQTERYRAVEKAAGDIRAAKGLIYNRRRFRSGRLSDGIR